jgi:rhodanese-related sulfurtransferase/signal-transduction protein with cAMP-binding, CBS, and nucleotidyltransferase domain
MLSVKMSKVVENLTVNFYPFNLLTPERVSEVTNLVRFLEMREGEIFQLHGGKGNDYLFVVEGSLEIIQSGSISTATPEKTKKRPISLPHEPASTTLLARANTIVCHADREMLDDLISWDEVVHLSEDVDTELHDRIESIRNSLVFKKLPMECVEEAFKRMSTMDVSEGDAVISQGEEGDAYYVITEGEAEVYQMGLYDDEPKLTASLGAGDAFGDEALVSGGRRNETVKMISDGKLLVLKESDFEQLIGGQLVKTVNAKIAQTMVESGYILVDVRYAEEFDEEHIPGCVLMPLYELRDRLSELSGGNKYIVYCHGGSRSAVAAMVMSQNNIDVQSLEGGIRDWPFETESNY